MILPSKLVLNLVCWMAERFGLDFDLCEDLVVESLDERETSEQLQYGRD